jgi:glucose/mannose-6-phosphate isomerase
MKELIEGFISQVVEAIQIGKKAKLTKHNEKISNVLIAGLGGSGIGGSIVSEIMAEKANVPINVSKGYFIPAYVNENSLVIISSYSGNTEETLNAMQLALDKKAKVVCVTSGGKVEEKAKQNNLDHIIIPGGMPPRACLGYSLTQLFFILDFFKIAELDFLDGLNNSVELLKKEEKNIKAEAKNIAEKLQGKTPVIYSTTYNEGLAIRLRQQLNENAKVLCWHHVFPELNHNELVGWTQENQNLAILILRDPKEYSRNNTRIEISKEVFKNYTSTIIEIWAKGNNSIEKAFYLINLGDWISWYLSEKRGVDATEIKVINHLKSELAKI